MFFLSREALFGNFLFGLGLLFLLLLPSPGMAHQSEKSASEDTQFAFAVHLLKQQDFLRAITEFKRTLFLFPSGARSDEANYLLGEALFQAKSVKEAAIHWEGVLKQNPRTPFKEEIMLNTGRAFWALNREEDALSLWEKLIKEGISTSHKTSAARAILWGLMKQKRIDLAREKLKNLPLIESEKGIHETFFQKAEALPQKSPTVAGTLAALLPGAGHWYLDRHQDALVAFSINGLFTWAAVSSFQQGNNGLGALLSFIELAWYSGNIYSAVNTAHKINRKQESDFLESYGVRVGVFSSLPSSPGLFLVLNRAF